MSSVCVDVYVDLNADVDVDVCVDMGVDSGVDCTFGIIVRGICCLVEPLQYTVLAFDIRQLQHYIISFIPSTVSEFDHISVVVILQRQAQMNGVKCDAIPILPCFQSCACAKFDSTPLSSPCTIGSLHVPPP